MNPGPIDTKSHDGTIDSLPVFVPGMHPGILQDIGIPLYYDSEIGVPSALDPINLRADGRAESLSIISFCKKGYGKTSDNMHWVAFYGMRHVNGRRMKIWVDDLRTNSGKGEYGKLAYLKGTEPVHFADYRLNLLDMEFGFTLSQQLHLVKGELELASRKSLNTIQTKALRYGLKKVRQTYAKPLTGDLLTCVRSMTPADIRLYETQVEKRFGGGQINTSKDYQAPASEPGDDKFVEVVRSKRFIGLLEALNEVGDILENLLDGEFGDIFGGEHSLADVFRRNLVVADYNELTEEAITLIQFMVWNIKNVVIPRIKDGDFEFFFDLEIHDENYSMWSDKIYASEMSKFLKRIRGTGIIVKLSTHRPADYKSVGNSKSREYKLATNMLKDIDIFQIGRLSPEDAAQVGKLARLTVPEQKMIPGLVRGTWLFKFGDEPARIVHSLQTPIEAIMQASEANNDSNTVTVG